MTDKKDIYDQVEQNVPATRPTIRRTSRDLIKELEHVLKILKKEGRKR